MLNIMPPELIEGFITDDFILSIVSLEKTTRTRAKSYTSKTQNVLAFDLPHILISIVSHLIIYIFYNKMG